MVNKVEQRIIELITPIVDRRKELLWDLTYTKEGGQKVLRILLDKPNHQFITMADLTAFTQEVNELLDTSDPDPIPEAYLLDISSPGADRPLKQPWHFKWAQDGNENILMSLFVAKNGQKKWQGKIKTLNDNGLVLLTDHGEIILNFDEIAKAVLDIQF
ncbi:ribosome maturation factor RimP [Leuconostoc gasicomitatum]|uniref:ribosome maturation factor RimP n=1 Tax=Leuconostoc gasicomitatum TaxID=115778 RepID=UPI001CC3B1C4|nr:ribosome maturation factor RimP [Leuconostoc gasicomitatum]MBZ5947994.1 ribosome maturation factor RimP [Leuconostoc gasicomitatum]MBZ5988215.1 ribosome maturation factor RimP [Leuconostoc gasicomitatum]MBZ5990118.1 ribosome maturation factor RimP [Leuconostoc gasicomitatum]